MTELVIRISGLPPDAMEEAPDPTIDESSNPNPIGSPSSTPLFSPASAYHLLGSALDSFLEVDLDPDSVKCAQHRTFQRIQGP